jgi:hypothetical protein
VTPEFINPLKNTVKLKYMGMMVTHKDNIHDKIRRKWKPMLFLCQVEEQQLNAFENKEQRICDMTGMNGCLYPFVVFFFQ